MEPVRVLQVITTMNRGGLETMLMNYYRNIDRTQIQFDFLLHRQEKGAFENEIRALGGRIYRLVPIQFRNFFRYLEQLNVFFKHHKYKIVHAHLDTLSTFVLHAAKKHGIAVRIAHSHNTNYDLDLKAIFRAVSRQFLGNQCTHKFACSKKAGLWLFGKTNDEVVLLNNAIDAQKFRYKENVRNHYRKLLNVAGKCVVGHIGRFDAQKNHQFIIDVFNKVYAKNNDARLLLVGDGGLKEELQKQVQDLRLQNAVNFLGLRSDVENILQAMDVFLFPSLYEGLPVTLIEAQAAGLKCIVSDQISAEVKITDLIEFIPLTEPVSYWAEQVLKYGNIYNASFRGDTYKQIVQSNYDIRKNAAYLANFYLKHNGANYAE